MNVSRWQYQRFGAWLAATSLDRVIVSFSQIEEIIGVKLPPSALTHSAWWSNSTSHPLARVWLKAGWRAQHEGLRWDRKEVTLVRVASRQAHDELKATDDDPAEGIASELTAHPVRLAAPTDWHDLL